MTIDPIVIGMTMFEIMAASLPVIIGSDVGAEDMLKRGIHGFVIEGTTNTGMICDKLGFMLYNETRSAMAQEPYNTAFNNSWKVVTKSRKRIRKSSILKLIIFAKINLYENQKQTTRNLHCNCIV